MISNTSESSVLVPRYDGLMSYETSAVTTLSLNYINVVISAIGIITNAVNVMVFLKAGPGLNATYTSFLALSLSDLTYLILVFLFILLRLLNKVIQTPGVPLTYISFALVSYWHFAYNMSVCITVYTAVQKASCVAIPLTFKNVFTVRRTVVILVLIVIGLLAFYLPIMSTMSIIKTQITGSNISVYSFSYAPKTITSTFDLTMQNILPTVTLAMVMICLLILVVKLRQASQFRITLTGSEREIKAKVKEGSTFSAREIKVVQAVTAVSTMFLICNLPPVVVTYATIIEPEFNDYRYYGYLYAVVGSARITSQLVCATVNIVVYFYFNTSYRSTLLTAFT